MALVFGEAHLSYGELERRANRLAHHLRQLGVGRGETPVATRLERSAAMVVACLAIVKAGGYYVPLDLDYPAERVAFMLSEDREIFTEPADAERAVLANEIFPDTPGRFSESDLLQMNGRTSLHDLTRALWDLAWRGAISSDTFDKVRRGVLAGFRAPRIPTSKESRYRGALNRRWQKGAIETGAWYRLPPVESTGDALDEDALNRDRARLLLDRYGVLFRELLERETLLLRWRSLFRTLRLLELSGEVVGGYFFKGVKGIQFASLKAIESLKDGLNENIIYWMNAADPG